MRLTRLSLLTGIALAAGVLTLPSSASVVEPVTTNACIASVPEPGTTDAVQICYSLFRPAGADRAHRVPVIFHSHGWGGSRTIDAASFDAWLKAGFGVLSFDQRGFGESGGKAHVENPDFEGYDVGGLVDVVSKLDWVVQDAPGDPRIGAIGGSYGGGYQFVGAFSDMMRRKGKSRFDALAPEITWWDLKGSLAPSEVVRSLWISALYAAGADAHTTTASLGLAYGAITGNWAKGEVPGADLDAFFGHNGPAWHVSQGRRLDIPVLFGQGITDTLFPLHQGLTNYDKALTPRARAKSMLVGYNGGHVLPTAFPMGVGADGDPCSKKLGGGSFSDLARRFMTENLKRKATGLRGFGQYHLATVDGACITSKSMKANTPVAIGPIVTPTGVGAPVSYQVGVGPMTVSGTPYIKTLVSALGVETRAFFGLAIGTSVADAKIVQNNLLPLHEQLPVLDAPRTIELPSVAVQVPEGQNLYLTVSPVSEQYYMHGSRIPGAFLLSDVVVHLPVVR